MAKKTKSRADGEGSIYQREKNGRLEWVSQVTVTMPDGLRKPMQKVSTTQAEARRKLTEMKSDQDAHRLVVSGKATVRNWLDVWLEEFIRPNRAPGTYTNYFNVLKNNLSDRIAHMPLVKLAQAPEDLQREFNRVAALRACSASLLRRVLRSAFNKAVKLRRMPSNPVLTTDQVKYREPAMRTFTLEQAERFLRAAEDDRLGALYTITLSLGLREGEGIGLKPEDIDLDNRVIPVRHQLQWNKLPGEEEGHWDELPCKWNSTGDLPMTETIYRALVRHTARRQQEATTTTGWKDSGYLFVSVTGAPLHKRNVLTAFHKSCDAAGVPRIRFHDTRHTCGTLLHAQGAGEFTIQAALRHAQLSTTRRYVHVPTDVMKEAVTRVESGIEAAKQKMKEKERQERKAASEVQATVIQPQTEMIQ